MIPKFRLFDKRFRLMLEVHVIDFYERTIDCYVDDLGVNRQEVYSYEMNEDNYVLMRSTGLSDKNGKEIFEGDVVRAEHENFSMDEVPREYKPYIGFIKYIKTGYSIITKDTYHPCLSNIRITNIEVIGNIHEHSHLLEKEDV